MESTFTRPVLVNFPSGVLAARLAGSLRVTGTIYLGGER